MPGFPDKFTPFYKKPPGSTVSTMMTKLAGSFVRSLRRLTQRERNREKRWTDHVPSGWALEYNKVTTTHKVMEYFYDKLQYFQSERPGRQRKHEMYPSGYLPPAEAAYGTDQHEMLPQEREKIAQEKGLQRRAEI